MQIANNILSQMILSNAAYWKIVLDTADCITSMNLPCF